MLLDWPPCGRTFRSHVLPGESWREWIEVFVSPQTYFSSPWRPPFGCARSRCWVRLASSELVEITNEKRSPHLVGLTPGAHPYTPAAGPDNTHFLDPGAEHVATLAAAELRATGLPLAHWLK